MRQALVLTALLATPALAQTPITTSVVTPAAQAEMPGLCDGSTPYPALPWWPAHEPVSATSGTPRIDQVRNGAVIASYTAFSDQPGCTEAGDGTDYLNPAGPAASGCGPFTREHTYRLWAPGDTFLVYPAVYAGQYNQPWVGPEYDDAADYSAGIFHTPDNVTISGVVQNGTRPVILLDQPASNNTLGQAPVYFDVSTGFALENINVVAVSGAAAGKAGIYESGGSNFILRHVRVSGFQTAGVNGVFGAGNYSGTMMLEHVEMDHNGGPNGPSHNAYINASVVDPSFRVVLRLSYSHDAVYGHLFKSRAQQTSLLASYWLGGVPQPGQTQAEAYDVDVPNGGALLARDNVFVKGASGPGSNGISLYFDAEGPSDSRPQSAAIYNNTFVAYAATFDGSNPLTPMAFQYPAAVPSGFDVRANAFVGYCSVGAAAQDYRGDLAATEAFSELSGTFALATKYTASTPILGRAAVAAPLAGVRRMAATVGAED